MNKFMAFLQSARIINLFMLGLVQYIVMYCFVQVFDLSFYLLLSTSTILIAFGAYLLNDVQDLKIDEYNNKLRWVKTFNRRQALLLSYSSMVLGLLLGLWLSVQTKPLLFSLFILATVSLILYAYHLSTYKIAGNLLISLLISIAILLSFYLGLNHEGFTRKFYTFNEMGVWIYAAIAFLLNWIREIVKDMEDIAGDELGGRTSLPIALGSRLSAAVIIAVLLFFVLIFIFWLYSYDGLGIRLYLGLLTFLALASIVQVKRSKYKKAYRLASLLIKGLMLAGLLLPFSDIL